MTVVLGAVKSAPRVVDQRGGMLNRARSSIRQCKQETSLTKASPCLDQTTRRHILTTTQSSLTLEHSFKIPAGPLLSSFFLCMFLYKAG